MIETPEFSWLGMHGSHYVQRGPLLLDWTQHQSHSSAQHIKLHLSATGHLPVTTANTAFESEAPSMMVEETAMATMDKR